MMNRRDLRSGAIGAVLGAIVIFGGYKGKVAVSHAMSRGGDDGASSSSSPNTDSKTTTSAAGITRDGSPSNAAEEEGTSTDKANKNLVAQVGDYRSRLQAVTAEKSELEAKLKKSEDRLAASQDGSQPSAAKHDFDLGPDEWKELSKDGTIKFQMPCTGSGNSGWTPSPEKLQNLGLQPSDGATIKNAYAHTNKDVWAQIKPLCAAAVGSESVADKIGPDTCIHLVLDTESERDKDGVKEARKQVGEIRAGARPMPNLNDKSTSPTLKLFLAATGASKTLEDDLAQSFGPEEAHRLVYSDELCMGSSIFGGGHRPKK